MLWVDAFGNSGNSGNDLVGQCGHATGVALIAGGVDSELGFNRYPNGGAYGPVLMANNFEVINHVPTPHYYEQYYNTSKQGDITVFAASKDHTWGHVEGFTGYSRSGWTSSWEQNFWVPYFTGQVGSATIYRSRCPCGQ